MKISRIKPNTRLDLYPDGEPTVNTKEKIAVMQAWEDGETILYQGPYDEKPIKLSKGTKERWEPAWDWPNIRYWVEKKPREFWVNIYKECRLIYNSKEEADEYAQENLKERIHVREVIDDE